MEDRDMNCEVRLDSIIRALEEEKTICEDVMNSACQIRMFVNAPRSYANRKCQNRVGNSKRGRPKDANTRETPSKSRRVTAQPATKAKSQQNVANVPATWPNAPPRATPGPVIAPVPVVPSMHHTPSYGLPSSFPLLDQQWNWSEDQQGMAGANLFADFPEAATLDAGQGTVNPSPNLDFQEFWQSQQGVQELQFPPASEYNQMQGGNRPF